jgi:hypothetical protein
MSGGESGGGARHLDPQWVRDIIADCQNRDVAPFHKQWGTYSSNPLVVEQGMSIKDAKRIDARVAAWSTVVSCASFHPVGTLAGMRPSGVTGKNVSAQLNGRAAPISGPGCCGL